MKKSKQRLRIQQALLRWYSTNARDLPWRRTRNPYAIWVSEIMLQQTRVPTAIPYYERFLKRFPTLRHLARARLDTVLKLWEGLGYYTRARNLHRAAQEIVSRFEGQMPESKDDLLALPGIGRYTAGAIATVDHTYTHFRVRIHAFECRYVAGEPRPLACDALKWVRPADLARYAFPAANKKIIQLLQSSRSSCPSR